MKHLRIETLTEGHYPYISSNINDWWDGREVLDMLPVLFFKHFSSTSLIALHDETPNQTTIAGFLVGFYSPTKPNCAYIHFVGVNPSYRGHGVGAKLYNHFFTNANNYGAKEVRCVTSPVNTNSIAFHLAMGFKSEKQNSDGTPAPIPNYDGPGKNRISFFRPL